MSRDAVLPPLRCTPEDLGRWREAAACQGLTLSEWVRRRLTQAADNVLAVDAFDRRPKKV